MSNGKEIKVFADQFRNRLNSELIDQALDYVDNCEEQLALEILLDHFFEFNILMKKEEVQKAKELALLYSIKTKALERINELIE